MSDLNRKVKGDFLIRVPRQFYSNKNIESVCCTYIYNTVLVITDTCHNNNRSQRQPRISLQDSNETIYTRTTLHD